MPQPPSPANPPSADRALRALADAVGTSRPRVDGDAGDPAVPVAGTVLILRDGSAGLEVLLIERPDRGSFAGAWVFPGGKLEDADRREGATEEESARLAGVREAFEEVGVVLDPQALVTLSCWDPPPGLPLRIRTWFFLTSEAIGELTLQPGEVVAARWVRPAEMLERHGRGEVTLYPPTWVTLHDLAEQESAEAILAAARMHGLQRFETVARRGAGGPLLLWQEDAAYAGGTTSVDEATDAASARHRLDLGALPWVYVHRP
jgi:8-oxo-dGTP pyrophosphatase MutT (NUDIX family)